MKRISAAVLAFLFCVSMGGTELLASEERERRADAQQVSMEALNRKIEVSWRNPVPGGFSPQVPLEQIQHFVYAFPGYRYQSFKVELTDTKTDYTRNSAEREHANAMDEFIFDVVIYGSVRQVDAVTLESGAGCDTYFFSFSYSKNTGTYHLTGMEFSLEALPPDIESKALGIAGIPDASAEADPGLPIASWLKSAGGEGWYDGVPDGTVLLTVITGLPIGEGPELCTIPPPPPWTKYYVDVFNGRILMTDGGSE